MTDRRNFRLHPFVVTITFVMFCATSSQADIILSFEEQSSGGTVNLLLAGQLDVNSPEFVTSTDDGTTFAFLAELRTAIGNDALTAQSFGVTSGVTRFGTAPGAFVFPVSAPSFEIGYGDNTGSTFDSTIILPPGYTSGTSLNLSSVNFANSLADLSLTVGDSWGVSFTDGSGGSQSITFQATTAAVPEPSTFGLLSVFCGVAAFRRRRQCSPNKA